MHTATRQAGVWTAAIRVSSSLRLTVVCLALLFVLTVWGTLYQAHHGLHAARREFFDSWVFLAFGYVPFPGAQLALAVLFVNLLSALLWRMRYGWGQAGLILIHLGLLMLLLGGFIARRFGWSGLLTLAEGAGSNVAASDREWELAAWRETGPAREVYAVDFATLAPGSTVHLPGLGAEVAVTAAYRNCRAFARGDTVDLQPGPVSRAPEENVPGAIVEVRLPGSRPVRLVLFGGREDIVSAPGAVRFSVRRRRYPLPFVIRLEDFRKEFHPGSSIPKSFSSRVEVTVQGVTRPVEISMNRPFRHGGFAAYQASYSDDPAGRETSTFAIARNAGRLVPYAATLVTSLGLALHFLLGAARRPVD
jgi:hypothetical protein